MRPVHERTYEELRSSDEQAGDAFGIRISWSGTSVSHPASWKRDSLPIFDF